MEMLALHDNNNVILHTDQRLCDHPDLFCALDDKLNPGVILTAYGDYGVEIRNTSSYDLEIIKRSIAEFFTGKAPLRFVEANSAARQLSFRFKQPCDARQRTMIVEVLMTAPCGVAEVDMSDDGLLVVKLANSIFMGREPEIHRRIIDMITATLEWLESQEA